MTYNANHDNCPIVSVLMSVYNEENTISMAIESIINQTFTDWELVIVDDCSIDKTPDILKHYAEFLDSKINVIKNTTNLGLSASLNRGLSLSVGRYIARMDADDWSHPSRLQKQFDFLESHPEVVVLGTGATTIAADGLTSNTILLPETHEELMDIVMLRTILLHPSVMIRTSFFAKVGNYNESLRRAQDLELWVRGLNMKCIYHNLQEPLIKYSTDDYVRSTKTIIDRFYSVVYICLKYHFYFYIPYYILDMLKSFAIKLHLYKPLSLR